MALYLETGDAVAAAEVGKEYLDMMAGYSAPRASAAFDSSTSIARMLMWLGRLPRSEYVRLRDAEIERGWIQLGPEGRRLLATQDVFGLTAPIATQASAVEAVEELRQHGEPPYYGSVGGRVGVARFRAGDVEGALPDLERGAHELRFTRGMVTLLRTRLYYGEALEKKGERARACDEYGFIRRLWGHAKPRSVTAEEARKHATGLGCDAK